MTPTELLREILQKAKHIMSGIDDIKAAVAALHDTEQRSLVILVALKAAVDANPNDPTLVALAASLNTDTTELSKALDVAANTSPAPGSTTAARAAATRR